MEKDKLFFDKFCWLLKKSFFDYNNYIKFDKKYSHALLIKDNNINLLNLILKNTYLFEDKQRAELMSIVHHINAWMSQWNYFNEVINPGIEDKFDFPTIVKFPKQDLLNLEQYFYLKFNERFGEILKS
jgi:hypothetical protein